jgi:hypothetical protein
MPLVTEDEEGENSGKELSLEEDLVRLTNTDGNWDDSDDENEFIHRSVSKQPLTSAVSSNNLTDSNDTDSGTFLFVRDNIVPSIVAYTPYGRLLAQDVEDSMEKIWTIRAFEWYLVARLGPTPFLTTFCSLTLTLSYHPKLRPIPLASAYHGRNSSSLRRFMGFLFSLHC